MNLGGKSLGSSHFSLQIFLMASSLQVKVNTLLSLHSLLLPSLPFSLSHSTPAILVSLLFLREVKPPSTSGPLHMLFVLPGSISLHFLIPLH